MAWAINLIIAENIYGRFGRVICNNQDAADDVFPTIRIFSLVICKRHFVFSKNTPVLAYHFWVIIKQVPTLLKNVCHKHTSLPQYCINYISKFLHRICHFFQLMLTCQGLKAAQSKIPFRLIKGPIPAELLNSALNSDCVMFLLQEVSKVNKNEIRYTKGPILR